MFTPGENKLFKLIRKVPHGLSYVEETELITVAAGEAVPEGAEPVEVETKAQPEPEAEPEAE